MLKSMTGFGKASGLVDERQVVVEIRCVNHRYKDVRVQLFSAWSELEVRIGQKVRDWLGRGRADCLVRAVPGSGSMARPVLDDECARRYLQAYRELARLMWKDTGVEEVPALSLLAAAEGVITLADEPADAARTWQQLEPLLDRALDEAEAMRRAEGERLQRQIEQLLASTAGLVQQVRQQVPGQLQLLQQRLRQRVQALAGEAGVEPQRLAQEVALLAERADVTEELDRLDSHLQQFDKLLASTRTTGRQMDFLLQEMNREANTLAAKMQSAEVVALAVELKAEVERIREQVQNVE